MKELSINSHAQCALGTASLFVLFLSTSAPPSCSTDRAGVFTDSSDQDKGAFNPRLGVVYRVTPEIGLRAATYTGFQWIKLISVRAGFFKR